MLAQMTELLGIVLKLRAASRREGLFARRARAGLPPGRMGLVIGGETLRDLAQIDQRVAQVVPGRPEVGRQLDGTLQVMVRLLES